MNLTDLRYKHGVISELISPDLLRNVRSEIQEALSFTPKETDIYKIHQSGDLANLDGLDDSSLKLLPSLLRLRNALYSPDFRVYLSTVTGSGPLSGKKTDMAINVYTPGCHLLCHDDVIGSRRVSYILYLTDPDTPWKKEWGGALRLYPTQTFTGDEGKQIKVPLPDWSVSIPPAFNQLSFFAVQPGESFHDVEEVYASDTAEDENGDKRRVRMAISGWYHIPQEGEEGYEQGLEERLAEKSSLMQLQGKGDKHDLPLASPLRYKAPNKPIKDIGLPTPSGSQDDIALSEEDLDFLLKYIAPTYLTPDTLESVASIFNEESSLCLDTFLSSKFSDSLRKYINTQESEDLPPTATKIQKSSSWTVARPPHKHRFLFQSASDATLSPIQDLLRLLVPSQAFRKWLQLATGQTVKSYDAVARRFRRGQDYTLAQGYEDDNPRLELCLAITPSPGWDGEETSKIEPEEDRSKGKEEVEGTQSGDSSGVGGHLAYMAGDDADDDVQEGSDHGVEVPSDLSTGARATKAKKSQSDLAIYKAQDEDDDGVLFSMPAGWNRLGVVLRDRGTMRFVKYVSRQAQGDRWDVVGEFELDEQEWEEDEEEGKEDVDDDTTDHDDTHGFAPIEESSSDDDD